MMNKIYKIIKNAYYLLIKLNNLTRSFMYLLLYTTILYKKLLKK